MTSMPAIALLAGGIAKRLGSLSESTPKAMLHVAGEPFIAHQLRLMRREGVSRVVICIGHLGEQIEDFVRDGSRFGVSASYSYDGPTLLGTGGALKKALPLLGDDFIVLYGDSYLDFSYERAVAAFRAAGVLGLMTVYRNEGRWDESNVEFADNSIRRYDKQNRTPAMRHIDYGMGVLRPEALSSWPAGELLDMEEVYKKLIERGQLVGLEVADRFYEIGSPKGLAETDAYLRGRRD